ncbi:hypothetical protein XELAEV_18002227mg [Xenopus laevis]|nr:hypothetical protein XELAEV_18002227mg [Xenopus laevis]
MLVTFHRTPQSCLQNTLTTRRMECLAAWGVGVRAIALHLCVPCVTSTHLSDFQWKAGKKALVKVEQSRTLLTSRTDGGSLL